MRGALLILMVASLAAMLNGLLSGARGGSAAVAEHWFYAGFTGWFISVTISVMWYVLS